MQYVSLAGLEVMIRGLFHIKPWSSTALHSKEIIIKSISFVHK